MANSVHRTISDLGAPNFSKTLLTSVHHLYGSIIYHTPWRAHVLFLSIPVIIITQILSGLLKKNGDSWDSFLFWTNWTIILLASVVFIGLFEGLYNHVLKNVLFFSGFPANWMAAIFPPNLYEMPNDIFFEITGVMQGVIAILLIKWFIKLTGQVIGNRRSNMNLYKWQ